MKKTALIALIIVIYNVSYVHCTFADSIDLFYSNDKIWIDKITINGITIQGKFIIDTGSELTSLDKRFENILDLKQKVEYYNVHDSENNIKKCKKFVLSELKLGNSLTVKNIRGYFANLQNIDGIIGNNYLINKLWHFDFTARKLYCLNDAESSNYTHQIPFKIKKGCIFLTLKINNTVFKDILLDTGDPNRIWLTENDTSNIQANSIKDNYYITSGKKGLFSLSRKVTRIKESLFSPVYLNDLAVDSCYVLFYGTRRIVGLSFLKESSFIIDFKKKKIYTNGFPQVYEHSFWGCRFTINSEGKVVVNSIRENSIAEQKGIKLNDILIIFDSFEDSKLLEIINNGSIYEMLNSETNVVRRSDNKVAFFSNHK
jgi:hypothetical protein